MYMCVYVYIYIYIYIWIGYVYIYIYMYVYICIGASLLSGREWSPEPCRGDLLALGGFTISRCCLNNTRHLYVMSKVKGIVSGMLLLFMCIQCYHIGGGGWRALQQMTVLPRLNT